jgi:hypothetical protein
VIWNEGDELFTGDTIEDFASNGGAYLLETMVTMPKLRAYLASCDELLPEERDRVDRLFVQQEGPFVQD